MKKSFYLSTICLLVLLMSSNVFAGSVPTVSLYLDSNPNVNGPAAAFDAWQTAAFNSVEAGTFTNMSNGTNPANVGTTNVEIQDEVAYSFGDTGRNLAWIYQIQGTTVESLQSSNTQEQRFGISLVSDWDVPGGWSYTFFTNDEPHHWANYDTNGDGTVDGVIGSANWGWWGAYGVNTQAALDADYADWGSVGEHWTFTATLDGVDTVLEANRAPAPVPEPATLLLLGSGLAGLAFYRRKRK